MLRKAFLILALVACLFANLEAPLASQPVQEPAAGEHGYLPLIQVSTTQYVIDLVFEFSEVVQPDGDPRQLAVLFHSLTAIDARGKVLRELVFGTEEANQLQGEGWFENELCPDVGTCQWTGGAARRARLQWLIPGNTEGLLLHSQSVVEGLWMDVSINGELAATLRVDAYWHSGYAPVGAAKPESPPPVEPQWLEDQYFPHFPPTDSIYVFPVPTELESFDATSPTWRINQSYRAMMTLTIVGMQGIINRNQPRVYLDYRNQLSDASRFWVPYLAEHIQVVDLDLDYLSIVGFLLRRYKARFSGSVIYDPAVPDTINLATMIAGLENRMILAPEQLALPGIPDFESVVDLRELVQEQGWDNTEESRCDIYEWVFENLWPALEHRIVGVINPGPPVSGEYMPGHFNPFGMAQRDYYVALRLSAIYLDPGEPKQAELYGRFLGDAPSPIPVTGVSPWESTSVPLIAQYGDWNATLSYPQGSLSAFNLTVFSGVRPDPQPYQPEINAERILATLGSAPVATVFSSDGDNISMQMDRGFHGGPDWVWEKVQGSRFGWTMNPTLVNLAPVIWNYYVDSRDEVEFVCGLSGAGATLIDYMNESQFTAYLEKTAVYLDQTGLRTIHVHFDKINRWTHELASFYHEGLNGTDFLGAIAGPRVGYGLSFTYEGVPSPAAQISYQLEPSYLDEVVTQIFSRNNDDIFFDFATYPDHKGTIILDPEATNGKAALFSNGSTEYVEVMTGPLVNLPAGEYTANFRFKVSDNQSPEDFLNIKIGHMKYKGVNIEADGWEELTRHTISPDEFEAADQYQLIHVPFTLDDLTTYAEIIMEHRGAYADLTADYFSITRSQPTGLPVFAVLFIPTLSAERLTDTPRLFAEEFEGAGGVLLTPDEFMVALNPETMIEFAIPYLGADHPAIAEANQQLLEGAYLSSLLTIRVALSAEMGTQSR